MKYIVPTNGQIYYIVFTQIDKMKYITQLNISRYTNKKIFKLFYYHVQVSQYPSPPNN